MAIKYVQTNTLYLAGSGTIIGAVNVVLTSLKDIYGNVLTMTDFGAKGYITLEPDTSNEEAATFTSITANANGTYTLGGVSSGLAKSPYTETSGLVRAHGGGQKVVVTDNVEFWNTFTNKNNDETVTGQWTFVNTPIVPGTVSDASTTVKGVSKTSVAPVLASNPIVVGDNDPRVPVAYAVDSVGTDAYAITPSPAITAYAAGQTFTFKAGTANTGAATINVNGLGAKTIKKSVSSDLITGDIILNQIVTLVYDGTNMQMTSSIAPVPIVYKNGVTAFSSGTQNIAHGLGTTPRKVRITSTSFNSGATQIAAMSIGAYDGTTNSNVSEQYSASNTGAASYAVSNSTSYAIRVTDLSGSATGVVTFDATNIIITWTGSVGGTATILWEANS